MGVTKGNRDLFIYGSSEEYIEILEQHDEDEGSESVDGDEAPQGRKNLNRNRPRQRPRDQIDYIGITSRRTGAKQARRSENLRQLLSLAEKDELGDFEFDNFFEPSVSAFARLFSEREKMKIWNDFVNQSEEKQEMILHPARPRTVDSGSKERSDSDPLDDTWEEIPDKRADHPAYSAEDCFKKVERKLKDLLKKRHLPMGMLECIEEEVVSFFIEWPNSVFISKLSSSFERMLLHALCQFLDLRSQSYDEEGERRTQIENKHSTFLPPSPLLSQYLQQLHSLQSR